jgi:hypothetical protein
LRQPTAPVCVTALPQARSKPRVLRPGKRAWQTARKSDLGFGARSREPFISVMRYSRHRRVADANWSLGMVLAWITYRTEQAIINVKHGRQSHRRHHCKLSSTDQPHDFCRCASATAERRTLFHRNGLFIPHSRRDENEQRLGEPRNEIRRPPANNMEIVSCHLPTASDSQKPGLRQHSILCTTDGYSPSARDGFTGPRSGTTWDIPKGRRLGLYGYPYVHSELPERNLHQHRQGRRCCRDLLDRIPADHIRATAVIVKDGC